MLRITLSYLLLAILSTSITYFFIHRARKKQSNSPATFKPSDIKKGQASDLKTKTELPKDRKPQPSLKAKSDQTHL